mmetsp:Transcript_60397/g.132768  ORF Transcript_60397/g.132768 Transcript_60397/m.132768 type:complete len:240 (-) Transcript_60397:573-1292(-)
MKTRPCRQRRLRLGKSKFSQLMSDGGGAAVTCKGWPPKRKGKAWRQRQRRSRLSRYSLWRKSRYLVRLNTTKAPSTSRSSRSWMSRPRAGLPDSPSAISSSAVSTGSSVTVVTTCAASPDVRRSCCFASLRALSRNAPRRPPKLRTRFTECTRGSPGSRNAGSQPPRCRRNKRSGSKSSPEAAAQPAKQQSLVSCGSRPGTASHRTLQTAPSMLTMRPRRRPLASQLLARRLHQHRRAQ